MLNNKKENKRLPMPGKVKKGFRCYCTLVMAAALLGCCSMTAFAADDPLNDAYTGIAWPSFRSLFPNIAANLALIAR